MTKRDRLVAFLATLGAIVMLATIGSLVIFFTDFANETKVSKTLGALSFIGLAISALSTLIGTFRPNQNENKSPEDM